MLGARSMALVGASPRPDSFGSRMIIEAQRGSARFHLSTRVRPHRRSAVRAVDRPTSTSPSTWFCSASPTPCCSTSWRPPPRRGPGPPCCSGPRTGCGTRSRPIATDAGMAVCGAGCMGFVNNALGVRALGYLEPDPLPDGGVSLVTHSGSAFSTLLRARRGFGFRLAVSSGQETRHRHRRLRRLRARRPRNPHHRTASRDTARSSPPAKDAAARRRAGCAGGDPHRRRFAAGAGHGRRTLGRAGRRARGMAGVLRGHRRRTRQRSRRVQRHHRAVLRRAAGQARRHCDGA